MPECLAAVEELGFRCGGASQFHDGWAGSGWPTTPTISSGSPVLTAGQSHVRSVLEESILGWKGVRTRTHVGIATTTSSSCARSRTSTRFWYTPARLDHRRPGAHPHRPGVPAASGYRHRRHPRGRRRHRRLQHPVRGAPGVRTDHRYRDESAGFEVPALASKATGFPIAKIAARLAIGYTPRRDRQRHHRRDAGVVRADAGLRRGEGPQIRLREVPAGGFHADHHDEERR